MSTICRIMFWLNVDYPTGIWKLHLDSCRFCVPEETINKGVDEIKDHGGWMSFDSYEKADSYFKENSKSDSIWQPCKVCNPGKYYKNRE
jgi:hypothetical protein